MSEQQPASKFEPLDRPMDSADRLLWASFLSGAHDTASREISPGVWSHTFTPESWTFAMSPKMHHRLRVLRLYATHPLPDYALRKCVRRRIVAARQAGMKRIRRMERREEQREAELLRDTQKEEARV